MQEDLYSLNPIFFYDNKSRYGQVWYPYIYLLSIHTIYILSKNSPSPLAMIKSIIHVGDGAGWANLHITRLIPARQTAWQNYLLDFFSHFSFSVECWFFFQNQNSLYVHVFGVKKSKRIIVRCAIVSPPSPFDSGVTFLFPPISSESDDWMLQFQTLPTWLLLLFWTIDTSERN